MDCANLNNPEILDRTIIPGDTQTLKLANNRITDEKQLKETLVTLTSLRELQLHGNELAKLNEATFAQNCNLEVISLGHGNAEIKLPETVFVGASSVKILDLGASFTKIHAELFSPLTNLEYLFLQFNEVGRLSSSHFYNNQKLEYVDASSAQIDSISDNAFTSSTALKQVLLRRNSIKTLEPETFQTLGELSWLDLGRNQLQIILPGTFTANTDLKILDLDQNLIDIICPTAFSEARNSLEAINLAYNRLPEELNKNFCLDGCDGDIDDFWHLLDASFSNSTDCLISQ